MFTEVLEGLMGLSDRDLDARIRDIELERRKLDAELAAAVTVADHRQLPAVHDHRSINAYLRATINCSSSEASRLRSLARAVDHIDGLGEAWYLGRIGSSQAVRFSVLYGNRRVRDRLPEFTPMLLDHAERLPHRDFGMCVDEFVRRADPDGAHDARDDAVEHRDAHVRDVGGMLDITAHGGDGLVTAELIAIHQRFTEAEYRADLEARRAEFGADADQHPLPRTAGQRRFDALAAMGRRAAAADGAGSTSDPLVNIVIDASTWAELLAGSGLAPASTIGGQPIDPFTGIADPSELIDELIQSPESLLDRRCETSCGVAMHPHDVLRAALAGHVRRVVVDADGVVIDMGRRQRLFTGSARAAAKLLIRRCEHPGCDLPADFCDVDHVVEWADGGTTDQSNSDILCNSHNAAKTKQRWRRKRAADGRSYTIRVDGTVMLPVGVRPPTFPSEDDEDDVEPEVGVERMNQLARARLAALTAA